jgi:DNA-binding IclR family transcriptional regulator
MIPQYQRLPASSAPAKAAFGTELAFPDAADVPKSVRSALREKGIPRYGSIIVAPALAEYALRAGVYLPKAFPKNMSKQSESDSNGIQVIERAANILRTLRDEPSGLSLGQIAERTSLPRSTVQRIVNALVHEGFAFSGQGAASFRLGPELRTLAGALQTDITDAAHEYLKVLSDESGETVDLALLRRDHMVFADQVVGSHRLRAVSAVGDRFPLHCTANGKAALAMLAPQEVMRLMPRRLERMTTHTIGNIDDLQAELAKIRQKFIAFDREEHSEGISAIGTSLIDGNGSIYAISIPMPTHRFKKGTKKLEDKLQKTAVEVARAVGGRALSEFV